MHTTLQQTDQPAPAGIVISALPFLLAAVVFTALPQIAHADDGCDEFRGPPAHQHGGMPPPPRGMMGGGKPPMNMQRPGGPFAELGLSDVQQKKMDELMRAQSPLLCEAERTARLSMQELQQLSRSREFDEKKAGAVAEAHGKAVADLAYLHAEMHARIWRLLSDSQRKRIAEQEEQRKWATPDYPLEKPRHSGEGRNPE
ncbi:MAG: Spy/CpxP family protein refolding chaperone [Gallionella sp.]|jgi:Spy/CpxP family protein refolding chaperone|nr:Spy/CpxP family protein refolding chaperone [Gallionella sp.]